ncbi:hypothetical protein [Curtobacterium sp. UNCCL20]|uniref:hypothetical protein n=1 Tax=Curtobacterium sp. UNCCL20 TaxID=1502773 RepID=UPI001113BE09|nr:hypothetical protein [Curtobacterium sp. UNCCL20]
MKSIEALRMPRPGERAIVDALADVAQGESMNALRQQAAMMLVAANCGCGCGSFNVSLTGPVPTAAAEEVPTLVSSEPAIEVLPVFGHSGRLASVEVTYFLDEASGVPAPGSLMPGPSG